MACPLRFHHANDQSTETGERVHALYGDCSQSPRHDRTHQESRTFTHRTAALSWARHREVALEEPAALTRQRHGTRTLAELIHWYVETFETISRWQRSKQTHLEFLERHSLGKLEALTLTSADLIRHVQLLRAEGAGPATVLNDLIWIGVVLRAARSVKELPVRLEIVQQARTACCELRLVGKPRKRTRRPTAEELKRLLSGAFQESRSARHDSHAGHHGFRHRLGAAGVGNLPARMARQRQNHTTGMVGDAKHPTAKDGNYRRFKYTPEAWALVTAQPQTSEYIFPYDPKSVGTAFTRACKLLGIQDLRFHDLRHEASRLFERGYQIHEVAQFTPHDSWNELKRYTNLKPENLRDIVLATTGGARARPRKSPRAASPPSGDAHHPGMAFGLAARHCLATATT